MRNVSLLPFAVLPVYTAELNSKQRILLVVCLSVGYYYYIWKVFINISGHNQFKSFLFPNVRINTKSHQRSALHVSEDPPHHWECCLKCLLLLLRSLGYAVPRKRPCLMTTSSIWHWSMLTSTVVLLSVFMRKMIVKTAISNSGLVPMKVLPTGLTNPCQLNCRFRTWSSWSGYGQKKQVQTFKP